MHLFFSYKAGACLGCDFFVFKLVSTVVQWLFQPGAKLTVKKLNWSFLRLDMPDVAKLPGKKGRRRCNFQTKPMKQKKALKYGVTTHFLG